MIDKNKIFGGVTPDVSELLMALLSPENTIDEKKVVWKLWKDKYYSMDALIMFFSDTLFNMDGYNYLTAFCECGKEKNFFELAMSMDMGNIDPNAYYLFWILNYGHDNKTIGQTGEEFTQIVKDAYDYDPERMLNLFPDIEKVVFDE